MEHDPKLFALSSCTLETDPSGLVSYLRMPQQSTTEIPEAARDQLTLQAMVRAGDPRIGRYLSFIPLEESREDLAAVNPLPTESSLSGSWDDISFGPIRLATLREDGCVNTGLTFVHHVVFARAGARYDSRLLTFPAIRQIATRRTKSALPDTPEISAETLKKLGFVDELFEGSPTNATYEYARRHEGRLNGEAALYEVQRLVRRRTNVDFGAGYAGNERMIDAA